MMLFGVGVTLEAIPQAIMETQQLTHKTQGKEGDHINKSQI